MARVLFLQNIWIEYYGVMQISSVLKSHGHEVDILFQNNAGTIDHAREFSPHIIAYSCMSIQWEWAEKLYRFARIAPEKVLRLSRDFLRSLFRSNTTVPLRKLACEREMRHAED